MNDKIEGWHFTSRPGVTAYDNLAFKVGTTLKVDADLIDPCYYGLHLSANVYDALKYAPGPYLYRVRGAGVVKSHSSNDRIDKYACSERTVLAGGGNASELLRVFARSCALDVIHLWSPPEIAIKFLRTGDPKFMNDAYHAASAAHAADAAAHAAANAAVYAADAAARAANAAARAANAANATYAAYNAAAARAAPAHKIQSDRLEKWALDWIENGTIPDLTNL